MKQYFSIKSQPEKCESDRLIYTAINGKGYFENNELHLVADYHYVYHFNGNPVGWYMKSPKDGIDRYLGAGASPSIVLRNPKINNEEYFNSLLNEEEVEDGGQE